MSKRFENLADVQATCWRTLQQCARDRLHEWRVMTLATAHGPQADARLVVIRDVLADARELVFYTDSRSPKVNQMRLQPQGVLVAWSRQLSWQLRMPVELTVHTSGLEVSSRWALMKMSPSAQDYLSPLPPGATLGTGQPPQPERATREHFAVVTARVLSMDWMELHAEGHRRALFDAEGARWVQP
jgi:pyridoxamine 5'-phosphate oxidase